MEVFLEKLKVAADAANSALLIFGSWVKNVNRWNHSNILPILYECGLRREKAPTPAAIPRRATAVQTRLMDPVASSFKRKHEDAAMGIPEKTKAVINLAAYLLPSVLSTKFFIQIKENYSIFYDHNKPYQNISLLTILL